MPLEPPFPYFGGKSAVAHIIWQALGNPAHYIEPFFGSGAVLFSRPDKPKLETICDKCGYVANVWRALQKDPDAVAKICDWPVNHADLSARKKRLIEEGKTLLEKLISDEDYFCPKLAGFWIWGQSCWIGTGMTSLGQIPHISDGGVDVHKLSQIPHISSGGMGVHKLSKIPHVAHSGMGVQDPYNTNLYSWFRALSERLRYVRIIYGDWRKVCGGNWQEKEGLCGMFFDPPYSEKVERAEVYSTDSLSVAHDVREWCLRRGGSKDMRIVLAGYFEEHESLLESGWSVHKWKAQGGYGHQGNGQGKINRHKEALFFSPHCLRPGITAQENLFKRDNSQQ
jgi:DNA adenine methylase